MDFIKIILEGAETNFMIEIVGRTFLMFLLILIVLRLSGRRGVRQLTLFEIAIILGLGSAAGDPMFTEDIPILYAVIVFITVISFYKLITFAASKSAWITRTLEGKEMIIVEDGMFKMSGNRNADFSQKEFFAELRNQSIEHLGQVRIAVLEVDGMLSILRYENEQIKYGLPLFPDAFKPIQSTNVSGPFACMFCGNIENMIQDVSQQCHRCYKKEWTLAINTKHVH